MQKIAHRINSVAQLQAVPGNFGIEADIRYHGNDLILHHDPFHHHEDPKPEKFKSLLENWRHKGPMILNVKTEGIERACIDLMSQYKIADWFFLDLSMPVFAIYAEHASSKAIEGFSIDNLAVRFSEREPIEYALAFQGKAGWVWVDCFTHQPLNKEVHHRLKNAGFKICLVAPELQKHPVELAQDFQRQLKGLPIDAVCTKRPDLW